jgi:uncharacterized Zn finger protein
MAKLSRTWWGQKFLAALEPFTDEGRLTRGRRYAGDKRILHFQMRDGTVTATVRGNVNPYFGVYEEPRYAVKIEIVPISTTNWKQVIQHLSSKAGLVSKLLMQEMPDNIEEAFRALQLNLLPHNQKDFKITECSCPDWANPCKHIAGVYYRLASLLDYDPLLLFELRGLSREQLREELSQSALGKILATTLIDEDQEMTGAAHYFTPPLLEAPPESLSQRAFWSGTKRLPTHLEPVMPAVVPAIPLKKAGDFPAFWHKNSSFIEVMEEFYQRVRTKNKVI